MSQQPLTRPNLKMSAKRKSTHTNEDNPFEGLKESEESRKKANKKSRKSGSSREHTDTPPCPVQGEPSRSKSIEIDEVPPTTPRLDKGKKKHVEADSDEDEDDEMDFDFKVLEIDREKVVGSAEPGKSMKLVTSFDQPAYTCHMDHMAPFRGILAEWRDNPAIAGAEISDLFRLERKKKLMAATTGREFTPESKRAIIFAVEILTGRKPKEVVPVNKSAWAVVTMENKEAVKKLLEQKAVYDPLKSMLITFRIPVMKATAERVFEVRNVKTSTDLDNLRNILIDDERVEILEEVPAAGEWTTVFEGRVVWKVKAPDESWQVPKRALTRSGNFLHLSNSPTCDTCHSDDHHFSSCPWKLILPEARFRRASRK